MRLFVRLTRQLTKSKYRYDATVYVVGQPDYDLDGIAEIMATVWFDIPKDMQQACDVLLGIDNGSAILADAFILTFRSEELSGDYDCYILETGDTVCGTTRRADKEPRFPPDAPILWQGPLFIADEAGQMFQNLCHHDGLREDLLRLLSHLAARGFLAWRQHGPK